MSSLSAAPAALHKIQRGPAGLQTVPWMSAGDGISLAGGNYEPAVSMEVPMSVARVVEISSTSNKSFDDAISQGIARANKTLREIRSAWVKEQEVHVDGGKIAAYKVNLMVTFVLEDTMGE